MIDFIDSMADKLEPHYPVMMAFTYGFALGVIIMDIAVFG